MDDTLPFLSARGNDALNSNRPVANNNITTHGSDLDWAICALHGLLLLVAIGWTYKTNHRRRIFNYFAISILLISTIYYFILASNLGSKGVFVEFRGGNIINRTRQVFYARWVGYLINFSLIFFALQLMSGVSWPTVWFTTGLTALWATMFLIGMFVRSSYKWGFFTFGILLWALVAWHTLGVARSRARNIDDPTHKTFTLLAGWEIFLMMLYPISWALSEGGNVITNDSEQIFYAVLDTLSQGIFAVLLMTLTRKLDLRRLRLELLDHGRIGNHEAVEKRHHGTNGHGNTYDNGQPRDSEVAGASSEHRV